MKKKLLLFFLIFSLSMYCFPQSSYWQQKVKYVMDIDMDIKTNIISGKQSIKYSNNSPDNLSRVFFHLYWNAYQANSMMDIHNRFPLCGKTTGSMFDDDQSSGIVDLKNDETGYQNIKSIKINGQIQYFKIHETIMEVFLSQAIESHTSVNFEIEFEAQVPLLVRRSGRDNPETGVRYSMSQWYPKICEYDQHGWHPTPYVEREFYGVWGDFEVNISIDKSYVLGGTGVLTNPQNIGFGYEDSTKSLKRQDPGKLCWKFKAQNVHDFMWAADPFYKHLIRTTETGKKIHVLYKNIRTLKDTEWVKMADATAMVMPYMEKSFGAYPYSQISIIEGGDTDGGMEYPMSCLVGSASLKTAFHEMLHNWYQGLLGTNESSFAWMDEGYTTYATSLVYEKYLEFMAEKDTASIEAKTLLHYNRQALPRYHSNAYNNYYSLVRRGSEEPLTTHADHFYKSEAYWAGVYYKGEIFLSQLCYIVGKSVVDKILLEYFDKWHFKHPSTDDFMKIAEDVSGLKLDWYKEYWINGTKTIDYAIERVWENDHKTCVKLKIKGKMPMPIDVMVEYNNGQKELIYIPQYLMFGGKQNEDKTIGRTCLEPWKWTDPTYSFELKHDLSEMKSIEIDPSQRMADVERNNNRYIGR